LCCFITVILINIHVYMYLNNKEGAVASFTFDSLD
jgi:hypothetical protein